MKQSRLFTMTSTCLCLILLSVAAPAQVRRGVSSPREQDRTMFDTRVPSSPTVQPNITRSTGTLPLLKRSERPSFQLPDRPSTGTPEIPRDRMDILPQWHGDILAMDGDPLDDGEEVPGSDMPELEQDPDETGGPSGQDVEEGTGDVRPEDAGASGESVEPTIAHCLVVMAIDPAKEFPSMRELNERQQRNLHEDAPNRDRSFILRTRDKFRNEEKEVALEGGKKMIDGLKREFDGVVCHVVSADESLGQEVARTLRRKYRGESVRIEFGGETSKPNLQREISNPDLRAASISSHGLSDGAMQIDNSNSRVEVFSGEIMHTREEIRVSEVRSWRQGDDKKDMIHLLALWCFSGENSVPLQQAWRVESLIGVCSFFGVTTNRRIMNGLSKYFWRAGAPPFPFEFIGDLTPTELLALMDWLTRLSISSDPEERRQAHGLLRQVLDYLKKMQETLNKKKYREVIRIISLVSIPNLAGLISRVAHSVDNPGMISEPNVKKDLNAVKAALALLLYIEKGKNRRVSWSRPFSRRFPRRGRRA